jgi:hypothetical protein
MPMTLQPEHERLIAEALRSGAYLDSGGGEMVPKARATRHLASRRARHRDRAPACD